MSIKSKVEIVKIQIFNFFLIGGLFIALSGCFGSLGPKVDCDPQAALLYVVKGTALNKTGAALVANAWDLETHQYTFSIFGDKKICKIGYKGNPTLFTNNKPYKIEIIKESTGTTIYTGNLLFNSNSQDEQSITPIAIEANVKYILKRTAIGYTNATETQGSVITFPVNTYFPITFLGYSIHNSQNSKNGKGIDNYGIPFIELTFE